MEKLTKEAFGQWVKDNNWLQIDERSTPNGRQVIYLSPAGQVTIAIHTLSGDLQIAQPMPVPMPTPRGPSPLDFLGGSQHSR
jgi:hypothetical protein